MAYITIKDIAFRGNQVYIKSMDLPDFDPKKQIMYQTLELIRVLRITPPTFYKYLRMTDIMYRHKNNDKAHWYTYDDLMILVNLIYPPKVVWRLLKPKKDK